MVRLMAVLFLAGCFAFQVGAQTAPGQGSATGPSKAEQAPGSVANAKKPAVPATSAWPLDKFTEFSAVMVGSAFPNDEREGHIYRSGDLIRNEGPLSRGYMITNLATSDTHALSVAGCMKTSAPFFRAYPFFLSKPGRKIERTSAGKETVDGHVCQVEDVIVTGEGIAVSAIKLRFWEAEDLHGFPIKVDVQAGHSPHSTIRYKDIVLGPQDATLFIYPKDCQDITQASDDDDEEQPGKKPAPSPEGKKPPADTPHQ
jgi:hypothetical protein